MQEMTFQQWLRREIDARLLTQSAFAQLLGVPRCTLCIWLSEANFHAPRGPNIVRLARALGVDREEIEARIAGRKLRKAS